MKKLLKKKVNVFGKGVPVLAIFVLGIALVSAALMGYFGVITGSVIINQGLKLDNLPWDDTTITYSESFTSLEAKTVSSGIHTLWNKASVDAEFGLVTTCVDGASEACGDTPAEDATTTIEYLLDADLIVWDGDGYIGADFEAGREVVTIILPADTMTLGQISTIEFDQFVTTGYPASVNILLDVDGDGVFDSKKDLTTGYLTGGEYDDVLKVEYAKVKHPYDNSENYPLGEINTFGDKGIIDADSEMWLYSGKPGNHEDPAYNAQTLAGWQDDGSRGTTCWYVDDAWKSVACEDIMINSDTKVYGIQIETLGFIAQSSAKVRNIKVNNVAYEMSGLPAGEQTDFEILTDFPKMILPDTYTITTKVTA